MRFLVLLGLFFTVPAFALCEQPLRVNVEDWRPYVYLMPDGEPAGMDVDTVRRMAAATGCRLVFSHVPPERSHALLASGDIDILMAASRLPGREQYALFSAPYRMEVMAVLVPAGRGAARPARGFREFGLGDGLLLAPRFGWYGTDYEQARAGLLAASRLAFYDDYAQGVAMLAAGRAGYVLGDEQALRHAAQAGGVALRRAFVANRSTVHLMFSRKRFSAADVARFDHALGTAAAGNR